MFATPSRKLTATMLAAAVAVCLCTLQPTCISAAEGVRFRDFVGVNLGSYTREPSLWETAIGANRFDVLWGSDELTPGVTNPSYLQSLVNDRVLPGNTRDVLFVPMLGYNTDWSWDTGDRTYYDSPDGQENSTTYGHAQTRYHMQPLGNNQYQLTVDAWKRPSFFQPNTWVRQSQTTTTGDRKFPLASDHVDDWVAYVSRTTATLQQYGVEYFQVWNEAHPVSGFFDGGLDEYMTRVHLPAAGAIHALGGKVVYGGWPDQGTTGSGKSAVQSYIDTLDAWDAWDSVDVLDLHYSKLTDICDLYEAAVARGRSDIAIWKTEYGFTTNSRYLGNTYARLVRWGLLNGSHDNPGKFKLFWFANWSPDSTDSFSYQRTLYLGNELYTHGTSLQTLASLLDGDNLRVRADVTNSRTWSANLDENADSVEAFSLTNRTVIAVHTDNTSGSVSLTIPGFGAFTLDQLGLWRVDQSGFRTDLTGNASIQGDNLVLTVSLIDDPTSPVKSWTGSGLNTFYVLVQTPEPSTLLVVLPAMLLHRAFRRGVA